MKIELKGRAVPRNAAGDPKFTTLGIKQEDWDFTFKEYTAEGILTVFSVEEVVELVNRALYQLEYQHNAHKVRAQRERDRTKAVRVKVKEMFHVSWAKATDEQIAKAVQELARKGGA